MKHVLKYGIAMIVYAFLIVMVTNPSGDDSALPSKQLDNDISLSNQQDQEEIANEEITNGKIADEEITNEEKNTQLLLNEPVEDKVCLGLFTTEQVNEAYYVLDDEAQNQLIPIINNLENVAKPDGIFKGRYYLGINIVYQGLEWQILSDGSLFHFSSDENGSTKFLAVNNELCENALQIAARDLGIVPFNPKRIKNIKRAVLTVAFTNNKEKVYKQTITDSSALSMIEKLFSEAEVIHGGSGCPFTEGIMTLILEDGQQIKIAMATDSCCVYFVNGIYFDYKPVEMRKKEDTGCNNNIIFDYFNEIPVATRGKDKSTNNSDSMVVYKKGL